MITKDAFSTLCGDHPAFGQVNEKLKELIRDELEPKDEIQYAQTVKVSSADGLVCMTKDNVYGFWTQKMFVFFKFPAYQTFHLNQVRKVESSGASVYLRAQTEDGDDDEDFEENKFLFTDESKAQEFADLVRQHSTSGSV